MSEEMVSLTDLMEVVGSGRVVAPVGTKTLFLLVVNPDGIIKMGGIVAPEHIDDIAFTLMKAKRDTNTLTPEVHDANEEIE